MTHIEELEEMLADVRDCARRCEERLQREEVNLRMAKDQFVKDIFARRMQDQKEMIERDRRDERELQARIARMRA